MGILVLGLVGVAILVPVGHALTISLISSLMPGQYAHCLALYWHLVIPMCPSCMVCSIFSLSNGGMMRASPFRMNPSSTIMMSQWLW